MNTLAENKKISSAMMPTGRESGVQHREHYLDETHDASFPASDSPNWTLDVGTPHIAMGGGNAKQPRTTASAPREKPPKASDIAERSNKGCVEFPDWMNEGTLCVAAPEVTLYGIREKLPIFPT